MVILYFFVQTNSWSITRTAFAAECKANFPVSEYFPRKVTLVGKWVGIITRPVQEFSRKGMDSTSPHADCIKAQTAPDERRAVMF